ALVFNNFSFGSQKLHQRRSYGERYIGSDHGNPDFAALARLFGARGARIEKEADFLPALEEMLEAEEPAVLDLMIDTGETPRKWAAGSGTR
ncbi:MAG: thiamine pyrophosphate-dependent enzyme, partial [Candidatus Bipolaricaulia bacterium]